MHPAPFRAALCGLAAAGLLAGAAVPAAGQETLVFRGARVLPISGPPIEDGAIVVSGGRFAWVGPAAELPARFGAGAGAGTRTIEAAGKTILPGLVDTHSHLGEVSGGDRSGPLHPEVRALDGVDVHDESLWRARAGGLTTINVMPGSGHLMSGQTVYLKLRKDPTRVEDWLFCDDATAGVCGSMKMANGTNSMRGKPFPGTRAKSAALVRELFVKARDYARKRDAAAAGGGGAGEGEREGDGSGDGDREGDGENGGGGGKRDLGLEAVAQILSRERRVQHHTHRHDDIATVLRLKEEFGFDVVLQHGTESWMLAEQLAAAGVGVSFTLVDSPGGKEEILRMRMDAPALLERAGVDVSLNTDDWITDSRLFLRTAALAVRHGMSREGALEAVTLASARQLGLDDRVGSIEPGKDADLVILSGDPLSVYTEVLETWVEGERVYDASDPEQRRYAVGGWRVFPALAGHVHGHGGCEE